MRNFFKYPYLLLFLLSTACTTYRPAGVQYVDYRITDSIAKDAALLKLMKPYGDSVTKSMSDVIGVASITFEKKQPESTMGNFFADAMLYAGTQQFKMPIDLAVVNYGGMRLNQLAQGPVMRGKVFEIMPFDNVLVLQQVKGDVLQQFLDHIAAGGGWPLAGDISMQIKNKKAINININGAPLDVNKTYNVISSDYLANGGDNAAMLKTVPQKTTGYLMRDALFAYINKLKREGKEITATIQNRITYAP